MADSIIIATGAVARRLPFKGSDEGAGGFWNKGISACAVSGRAGRRSAAAAAAQSTSGAAAQAAPSRTDG